MFAFNKLSRYKAAMEGRAFDFTLKTPASMVIIGPSQIGKSQLVYHIIKNRKRFFDKDITSVIYVYYKINQDLLSLSENDKSITLCDNVFEANKLLKPGSLLILDDLFGELKNREISKLVDDYFIRGCHHMDFSCILTLQKAFSKETKIIQDNTKYLVIFDSPRYRAVITQIAKNFSPKNIGWVQDAYKQATSEPRGYLMFDFAATTPNDLRVRSKVFPEDDNMLVFTA